MTRQPANDDHFLKLNVRNFYFHFDNESNFLVFLPLYLYIMGKFDRKIPFKRAYRADVTVHEQKYYDGDNAEVETYISISE